MPQIINIDSVNEAKSIMQDKFPLMIEYFLEDTEGYIKTMKEGVAESDVEKIKSPAHTIKSSAYQIGAEKMSEIAKEIEEVAGEMIINGENNVDCMVERIQELDQVFTESKSELNKLV